MEFHEIIIDSLSQTETSQASSQARQEMLEREPLEFIINLVKTSVELQNPSYFKICMTLLYSISVHTEYLNKPEIIIPFWEALGGFFQDILLDSRYEDDAKYIMSSLIATVVVNFRKIDQENTSIQEFLISLIQANAEFVPYAIKAISEILYSSTDFCGFDPDCLISLLDIETSPFQIINLFFAVASHSNDSEAVHEKFDHILELVDQTEEQKDKIFTIIENFAEKNPLFFAPHLGTFATYIKSVMISPDNPSLQNICIFIFQEIAENATEMCIKNPLFYEPVLDAFVTVMSQINEDSNYDFDPNDDSPCAVARNSFNILTGKISSLEAFSYFIGIKDNVLGSQEETGLEYGVIIGISEMHSGMLIHFSQDSKDEEEESPSKQLFNFILSECVTADVSPRIQYAGLEALRRLYTCMCINDEEAYGLLSTFFELIGSLEEPRVVISCMRMIKKCISHFKNVTKERKCGEIFEQLKELMSQTEDEELIVICLKSIIKIFHNIYAPNGVISSVCELIQEILDGEFSDTIKAVALCAFSNTIYEDAVTQIEGLGEFVGSCYSLALEIESSSDIDPTCLKFASDAVILLINYIADEFEENSEGFITHALETISTLPEIDECGVNEQIISSGYYYIPNAPQGKRQFIEKSSIETYTIALRSIAIAAKKLGTKFIPYSEQAFSLIMEIIGMEQQIEPIRENAFNALLYVLKSFDEDNEKYIEVATLVYQKLLEQASVPWGVKGYKALANIVMSFILFLYAHNKALEQSTPGELVLGFLPFVKEIYSKVDALHNMQIENQVKFDCVDDTKVDYVEIEQTKSVIIDLFGKIERLFPQEAERFFRENFLEIILERLQNPVTQKCAFEFLSEFIVCSHSESVFLELREPFIQYVTRAESQEDDYNYDVLGEVMEMFSRFFAETKVSEELAHEMLGFLFEFQKKELLLDEDKEIPYDNMVCAITNIMIHNRQYFNLNELFIEWQKMLPISNRNDYTFDVCFLTVKFLGELSGTLIDIEDKEFETANPFEMFEQLCSMFVYLSRSKKYDLVKELVKYFFNNNNLYQFFARFIEIQNEYDRNMVNEFLNQGQRCTLNEISNLANSIIKEFQAQIQPH